MKYIKVTNEIYTDENTKYCDPKLGWLDATPEKYYPEIGDGVFEYLKEKISHAIGLHYTFGQPYCVVCLKKQKI